MWIPAAKVHLSIINEYKFLLEKKLQAFQIKSL
jgi:hypothetical protein